MTAVHPAYVDNIVEVVEGYDAGADESEDHLFTEVFIDLKQANTKVAKLKTAEAVKILKDNYADYHALYAEKRKEWELMPAEKLADR